MNSPDLTLVGAYGSPYSRKMRAVLRYRHIAHRWIVQNSEQDQGIPQPSVAIIPVLAFHKEDGGYSEAMVDSSPQIMRLEEEYQDRSLLPNDPVVAFLDHLIEDYGDEWVTKMMYHYRWHHLYPDAIEKAGNMLPLMANNQMDPDQHQRIKAFITERQTSRTALVGSTDQNRPVIEESFIRLLTVMEKHLTHHQFLLGDRPGRGDFGIFGQFSQLCFWDPDSAQIAARQSPRSIMWVYQVDDLSSLDVQGNQGWFTRENLPATLRDLLHEIGQTYAPFMVANHDALASGAEKVVCSIRGANYQQAPFPYQSKCLTWLREAFAKLSPDDQESVRQLIDGTGCEVLVADARD